MYSGINKILIEKAMAARERACPYFSGFAVGAAILCEGGNIFTGCNIENPSIGLSICAERVAVIKALSEGDRSFIKMVIVADTELLTYPCGLCRQLIWEFAPGLQLILANLKGAIKTVNIADLLPDAFDFQNVRNNLNTANIEK